MTDPQLPGVYGITPLLVWKMQTCNKPRGLMHRTLHNNTKFMHMHMHMCKFQIQCDQYGAAPVAKQRIGKKHLILATSNNFCPHS